MNRLRKSSIVLGFTAVLGLSVLAAGAQAVPTATSGFDPSATLMGAVRYRSLNSTSPGGAKKIWVGVPTGSPATLSSSNESTYATGDVTSWGTSKCVQITYNGSGNLTTKVSNVASPCSFTSPLVTVTKTGLTLGTLNYLEIRITKSTPTNSIALNSVVLGADALGNFAVTSGSGTTKWKVTDIDLTSGFTLTGTIALNGLSGGGDSNYVEVAVGSVVPPDTDGPVTSDVEVAPTPVLLNGQATVTATVDDSTTGNHTVQSASYSLNDGSDTAMAAQDGVFDEVSEAVEATFTATDLGLNEVCVYGVDSFNNPGDPTCQTFLVTYQFDGFYSPIAADLEAVNVAKAGQAVPAKWRLTMPTTYRSRIRLASVASTPIRSAASISQVTSRIQ